MFGIDILKSFKKKNPSGKQVDDLYNWIDVESEHVSQYPNALYQIFLGEFDGMIIRNVIEEPQLSKIAETINSSNNNFKEETPIGSMFGKSLVGAGTDLTYYFSETDPFSLWLEQLFGKKFESLVEKIFNQLSGDKNVSPPKTSNDTSYKATTIRILHPKKGGIRSHVGNEFIQKLPQYDELASTVKLEDQLSYFIVLQEPQEGGELVLYDLLYKDTPDHLIEDSAFFNIPDERDRALEAHNRMVVKPSAGDMIIFDGGRIWHKVSDLAGEVDRITIGGFMAFSNDNKSIYYWS